MKIVIDSFSDIIEKFIQIINLFLLDYLQTTALIFH